jgi:hypothetical protein
MMFCGRTGIAEDKCYVRRTSSGTGVVVVWGFLTELPSRALVVRCDAVGQEAT